MYGFVCPLCCYRFQPWLSSAIKSTARTQLRTTSQLAGQRLPRMILSKTVSQPPLVSKKVRSRVRKERGPFSNMNRTSVGARVEVERQRQEDLAQRMNEKAKSRPPSLTKKLHRQREGTMKVLNMHRALARVAYAQRGQVKSSISHINNFEDFHLLATLMESLRRDVLAGMIDLSPTPIQRLAIPALLGDRTKLSKLSNPLGEIAEPSQYLLAAETGSGKTLAYTLPVLDAIKRAEVAEENRKLKEHAAKEERSRINMFELESPPLSSVSSHDAGRPKAIILVPSSELVEQVGTLVKAFSHTVKLRVSLISAAYSPAVIRNNLFGPRGVDVVVSTPHLIGNIAESDPNILSRVTHLVIDEADSLLDRSFAPLTSAVVDRAGPSLKQLVLCSATIPRSLDMFLQKRYPEMQRLTTPNLHSIPRRVQLEVLDIDKDPYRSNRDLACAAAIWQIGKAPSDSVSPNTSLKQVLVFVNERQDAERVATYLGTRGIDATALNRDLIDQRRSDVLSLFTSPPVSSHACLPGDKELSTTQRSTKPGQGFLHGVKVLVATDLGSRGIDTINVRNIVLYHVPHSTVDFIHRLGRTGRMGRRGKGVVLVGKDDRKDVVKEVREAMFMGKALV